MYVSRCIQDFLEVTRISKTTKILMNAQNFEKLQKYDLNSEQLISNLNLKQIQEKAMKLQLRTLYVKGCSLIILKHYKFQGCWNSSGSLKLIHDNSQSLEKPHRNSQVAAKGKLFIIKGSNPKKFMEISKYAGSQKLLGTCDS